MPDREFVHSTPDVATTLLFALDAGFQVRLDEPQVEPRPLMLSRAEAAEAKRGAFFLYRPEWMFGELQTMAISGGYNQGKYFVQAGVNSSPITVFFNGERIDQERRRLGSGVASFNRDWLELPAKRLMRSPPDVQIWFERIVKHMFSKVTIKAGVHKYHVCKRVLADADAADCLPPFDFIPWGANVLQSNGPGAT